MNRGIKVDVFFNVAKYEILLAACFSLLGCPLGVVSNVGARSCNRAELLSRLHER